MKGGLGQGWDMDFSGKVAVVTGGANGIGKATARLFAARHAAVAIVDRDQEAGAAAEAEIRAAGGNVHFFPCDVGSRAEVEKLIPAIVGRFSGIDILINNAGIQRYGSVLSTSEELWDEVMAANLKSAYLMSRSAVPEIRKRGGGSIVMTGSVQSVGAVVNSVAYVVSKHGLLGLVRAMALDHAKHNIRVNLVCPGATDTPLVRNVAAASDNPQRVLDACASMHAIKRMIRPEEVASVIVFLASDEASFVTGDAVMVDGGMMIACGGMAFQESGTGAGKD
jgi:NAD(P)-dependent dehydrogenase (short-subunit alcohol dehydrogenase family)